MLLLYWHSVQRYEAMNQATTKASAHFNGHTQSTAGMNWVGQVDKPE